MFELNRPDWKNCRILPRRLYYNYTSIGVKVPKLHSKYSIELKRSQHLTLIRMKINLHFQQKINAYNIQWNYSSGHKKQFSFQTMDSTIFFLFRPEVLSQTMLFLVCLPIFTKHFWDAQAIIVQLTSTNYLNNLKFITLLNWSQLLFQLIFALNCARYSRFSTAQLWCSSSLSFLGK